MKRSTIPTVRVEPELREQLEQADFVARGIASLDTAKRTARFVDADAVVAKLQARLDKSRTSASRPASAKR